MTELSLIAKATAILGLALVSTCAARRAPASVRALILATTFGLLLVLPIASTLAPPRELQIPEGYAPAFFAEDEAAAGVPLDVVAAPDSAAAETARSWQIPSPISLARGIWVLGVFATLAPLLLGLRRSRTIRRNAHEWADGAVLAATLRDSIGLRRPVSVVLHDDLVSPMTCGWRRPTIVMPADSPAWPPADVRHAMLHELEHVRRHDWAIHILARFTCALYWFHPGVWIAWRQLALESERACDDAVVARAENAAYAEQLVTLARRFGTTVSAPLLSMADRRTLATRVAAILNRNIPRGRVGAVCAAAIMATAVALSAVISPLHAVVRARAVQVSTAVGRAFEVASIRRNTSALQGQTIALQGNTFVARNVTARELVMTAFRVRSEDLSGGPGWLDSERYDVLGRPQSEATWEEHLSMVQRLLVDRFKLTIRRETRPSPIYGLVIGRNGPRLTPAANVNCDASAPGPKCGGFATRPGFFDGRRVTVAQVASLLSGRSGRLVLNRTGIEGVFDVRLSWTPDPSQLPPGRGPDDAPPFDPSGPSLFASIQEQLGLRLESATAEIDHFVIEHIERPTPNDAPELTVPEQPVAVQKSASPAPPQAATPAFDATSVRRNTSGDRGARQQFTEGRFVATNTSLRILLVDAFRIQSFQIVGGPEWLETARFDIIATTPPNTTPEQRPAMLRRLLAERFNLKTHIERRQLPIFALVANRNDRRLGPNLRNSAMECSAVSQGGPLRAPVTKIQPDGRPECGMTMGPASMRGGGMTMALLANALSAYAQRTVVDRTGFEGFYDFELHFAPRGPGIPEEAAAADPRPSIFTAVQEQLGLRLEAETGPVDVLIIDNVDPPSEN